MVLLDKETIGGEKKGEGGSDQKDSKRNSNEKKKQKGRKEEKTHRLAKCSTRIDKLNWWPLAFFGAPEHRALHNLAYPFMTSAGLGPAIVVLYPFDSLEFSIEPTSRRRTPASPLPPLCVARPATLLHTTQSIAQWYYTFSRHHARGHRLASFLQALK